MHACDFYNNLTILVNGSSTSKFSIKRWLKKDDPFSPFLFLLIAEVLSELFSRALDLDLFFEF